MLTLHFCSNSRSQRVLWTLEELELSYTLNKIKFHPSELKSEEHKKRHPLGRVPVLDDDDVTLFESGAIIDYVIEKYDENRKLKPNKDSKIFPSYLQWYHYCEGMVMPPMNTIVVHTILLPPDRRDENVLGQAQRLLTKSLQPIEENLEGKEYLVGDFTAADTMLGHACFMSNRMGSIPEEMINIKGYIKRLMERPAFKKAVIDPQ